MTANQHKSQGASTRASRVISAPRRAVYSAFIDPHALASWLPPDNMTGHVHTLDPRPDGRFHISLTYKDVTDSPDGKGGKSSEDTDIIQGRFIELVPDEKIVWVTEFDSPDPDFEGEMTITWTFADVDGGTEVTVLFENIPKGIRPEDNEAGSRSSLQNLATFLE